MDIKKLIEDLRDLHGLGGCEIDRMAADALERLSAENADLRDKLEDARNVANVCEERLARAERERDEARADLERAQAEAAAMLEALEKFNQWWFVQNYEADGPILISEEEVGALAFAARRAVSPGAGAALLAEVTRLREVERLAREYRKVVRDTTAHEEAKPSWFPNEDLEGDYYGKENELWHREEEAKEVFFDALGKEAE